jgi:hypothetical protein
MNPDKTDLLILGSKAAVASITDIAALDRVVIKPKSVIKTLGFLPDSDPSIEFQVNSVCRTCFPYLRAINCIV